MKFKKIISIIIILSLFVNLFSTTVFSESHEITVSVFNQLLCEMISNYNGLHLSSDYQNLPTNRLIVKTDSNDALAENYGAVDSVEGYKGIHIFQYETVAQTNNAYNNFLNDKKIIYVEHDFYLEIEQTTSMPIEEELITLEHLSWNSDIAQVDDAFAFIAEKGVSVNEIIVAVIDSGIYAEHEYFDSNRLIDSGYARVDEETNTSYPSLVDDLNHGTHVSGIIYDNTMDNIKLKPYRVFPMYLEASYSVVWVAFETAVSSGASVINMSLAGYPDKKGDWLTLSQSVDNASKNNVVVVVGAGNKRANSDNLIPANCDSAITVAATDKTNLPDISYSASGDCVDIAAPGTKINSTVPRLWNWYEHDIDEGRIYDPNHQSLYKEISGTSMATPLVTAAAATLKSISPDLSAAEIQRIIKETAYVPEGWDTKYGTGIVNFYNMVKQEVSGKPTIKMNSDGKIEITAPEGADSRLYYTLDGSVPTIDNHLVYTEPFSISGKNVMVITAVCHENGKLIGETEKYRTKSYRTLKIDYKETVNPFKNADARWYSWDPDIATVDSKGNITGVGVGKTTVTAVLKSGKSINYNICVEYTKLQWFIRIFLLGFLWY